MSIEGSYKKLAAANLRRTERYVKRIEQLLSQATGRFISLSSELPYDKSAGQFYFEDYPEVKKAVEETASRLARGMEQAIVTGTTTEWAQGTKDANGILDYMVQRVGIKSLKDLKPEVVGKYLNNHDAALAAFQKRAIGGMGLSDRVWNLANQSKIEAELARSIADGTSADAIAESMQNLLNDPGNLFRRVRDEFGTLRLSKRAKAYTPGAGVYRSSFQNARRLARTEINMAYRSAEQEAYADKDFVVGIEIKRSNNPYDCIVCETLAGKYPKDFKWSGWHPNCRCYMVPLLLTPEEMDASRDAIINGDEFDATGSANYVGTIPPNFEEWYRENQGRILVSYANGSTPYFIKDNDILLKHLSPERLERFKANYALYSDALEKGRFFGIKPDMFELRQLPAIEQEIYREYYDNVVARIKSAQQEYVVSRARLDDLFDYAKKHSSSVDVKEINGAKKMLAKPKLFESLRMKIKEILGVQESAIQSGLGSDIQAYMKTLKPGDISDLEMRSLIKVICNSDSEFASIERITTGYNSDVFAWAADKELFFSKTKYADCSGFCMVDDFKGAISAILKGEGLSFNQEYSVECLFHELKHVSALGWDDITLKDQFSEFKYAMEMSNQYCARREYTALLGKLGGKSSHLAGIKSGGYGYGDLIGNFDAALGHFGITEAKAYGELSSVIQTDFYDKMFGHVAEFFEANAGLDFQDACELLDKILSLGPAEFKKALKAIHSK